LNRVFADQREISFYDKYVGDQWAVIVRFSKIPRRAFFAKGRDPYRDDALLKHGFRPEIF